MARIPWNKGKKMSEEQRMVLSKVKTGKELCGKGRCEVKCSAGMKRFYMEHPEAKKLMPVAEKRI
jgi:hypothetical protein